MVVLGRRQPDDRDHYGKKRLDLAGPLMSYLFRGLFRKLKKHIAREIKKVWRTSVLFFCIGFWI